MKRLMMLMMSGILLALDLWSKAWIETNLRLGESLVVIPNFFELTYLRNTGAAWSLFDAAWMRPIFLILSLVVSVVCIYYFFNENNWMVLLGISFIVPGNLGNFYDRLKLGYVRDMLSFNLFGYDYPVFNFADVCLVVGFGFILLYIILEERKEHDIYKN